MIDMSGLGQSLPETRDAQEWLQRARVNAQAARVLVEQEGTDLRVEAVSQVQQACEKATKAVMLAQGMSYDEVKGMGHNTIGAFVNLMADMMTTNPLAENVSKVLLTQDATESAKNITKVVLKGRRNKVLRDKVLYAWKQVLPENAGNLGNNALQVEQWERLTRAFPTQVVELFIEFHKRLKDIWREYINEIPNMYADPRPLLSKAVSPEAWMFSPDYAGLPRRFPGQESEVPINPILSNIAQQLLNGFMEQFSRRYDPRHWPERINIRKVMFHINRWLSSLGWLFLCSTVTTPHATSSKYPAEKSSTSDEIGSQDYAESLGVVACIGPLAIHTDEAIGNLIRHYRDIEQGYNRMLR